MLNEEEADLQNQIRFRETMTSNTVSHTLSENTKTETLPDVSSAEESFKTARNKFKFERTYS